MEITFDPAKDASNIRKHGVSLVLASEIDWSEVMARPDTRQDYFELREIGYTVIHDRLRGIYAARRDHAHYQPAQGKPQRGP